jgi:hypothetical protein
MDDECCGVYQLEGSNNNFRSSDLHPSAKANMAVLVRIDRGAVDKIRCIGVGCKLDGGSLPFTWLTDVQDDDSVAWLSSLLTAADNKRQPTRPWPRSLCGDTAKASATPEGFASSANPLWLRERRGSGSVRDAEVFPIGDNSELTLAEGARGAKREKSYHNARAVPVECLCVPLARST